MHTACKTHQLLSTSGSVFLQHARIQRARKDVAAAVGDAEDADTSLQDLVDSHLDTMDGEAIAVKWRRGSEVHSELLNYRSFVNCHLPIIYLAC